jgi:hypothetical protein
VYGSVCTVVWEGEAVRLSPIPIELPLLAKSKFCNVSEAECHEVLLLGS